MSALRCVLDIGADRQCSTDRLGLPGDIHRNELQSANLLPSSSDGNPACPIAEKIGESPDHAIPIHNRDRCLFVVGASTTICCTDWLSLLWSSNFSPSLRSAG